MNKRMLILILFWLLTACSAATDSQPATPTPITAATAVLENAPTATIEEAVVGEEIATQPADTDPIERATPTNVPPTETAAPVETTRPPLSRGTSTTPVISDDGRVLAYVSLGNHTDDAANDGRWSAYLYDRETGETTLVAKTTDGQPLFDSIYEVSLSGNGRYVAYYSFDGRITEDDDDTCTASDWSSPCEDLFVYDRETGETRRIDVGGVSGLGKIYATHVSDDGRYVFYISDQGALIRHDFETGTAVSLAESLNLPAADVTFERFALAANGDLAFVSRTDALVEGDTNEIHDVFVGRFDEAAISRVSVATDGREANGRSGVYFFHEGGTSNLDISADGRVVVFGSTADNLGDIEPFTCQSYFSDEAIPCVNLYLRDRETGETRQLTNGNADSLQASMSADGRYVAFSSAADNLLPGLFSCPPENTFTCSQIYLLNIETGELKMVSHGADGEVGNGQSVAPKLSGDGRWLTFTSAANNLVPNDANLDNDIFLYNLETGEIEQITNAGE